MNIWLKINNFPNAIVHVDGDAFFASCETAINPSYRGKPLVTGEERGIVASLSYEAKKIGIKRGMTIALAKKIYPKLIVVPSDYETISIFSKRIFDIMRRFTPSVEEYSIDEGFADITGLRRPLRMSYDDIARRMKGDIERELGLTVSIGLAPTKTLAKIASDWQKPSGFTIISGDKLESFLSKLDVIEVWGIGQNTAAYMNKLGITKALDFAKKSEEFVLKHFTKPHVETWHELNGRMVMPLNTRERDNYLSISKTKTFTPPSVEREFVFSQLSKNIEDACAKARRHNLVARRVGVLLRTQEFDTVGLKAELCRPSHYPNEILKVARMLFDELFEINKKYRLTGVILFDLVRNEKIQLTLFEEPFEIIKLEKLYKAVDFIEEKYGRQTLCLGSTLRAFLYNDSHHKESKLREPRNRENNKQRLKIPLLK